MRKLTAVSFVSLSPCPLSMGKGVRYEKNVGATNSTTLPLNFRQERLFNFYEKPLDFIETIQITLILFKEWR